jgi:hypothetical protein
MTWQTYQPIDEVEVVPKDVDKTYKTYWDGDSGCWKNTWIYRIRRRMETEYWLKENYKDQYNTGPGGWNITFDRLVMGEKIYLHYCLAKPEND